MDKPLLTSEYREKRIQWSRQWFDRFSNPSAPVAFFDEKWLYTTNRRQTMKIRPAYVVETGSKPTYHPRRNRSRRHPTKVMFLRVVACPQVANNFDGKDCLHQVSQTKIIIMSSRNK